MIEGNNTITVIHLILTIVAGPIFVLAYAFWDQYIKELKDKHRKQRPLLFL